MAKKKDIVDELVKEVEQEETQATIEMNPEEPPKKSKPKRKPKLKSEEKTSLENQLIFLYSVVNNVLATRIPEFATITEEENKKLATSTLKLMEEYGIRISGKYSALFGFISTHMLVYGFRVYAHIQMQNQQNNVRVNNEEQNNLT